MVRSLFKLFRSFILLSLLASGVHYLINHKSYTFKVADIKRLGEKYAGQHPNQCLPKLIQDLRATYGEHVLSAASSRWVSLSLAGKKARVYFLHSSITEFLLVVGYPMATVGSSGMHWTNETCTVLTGNIQLSNDNPSSIHRQDFGPGDQFRLGMFERSIVAASDDTWTLCYGRGFLPTSLPYLTLDTILTNADPLSVGQLFYVLAKSTVYQTALSLEETFDYYKRKFM